MNCKITQSIITKINYRAIIVLIAIGVISSVTAFAENTGAYKHMRNDVVNKSSVNHRFIGAKGNEQFESIQSQNVQPKNVQSKNVHHQLLETIDELYINTPPGLIDAVGHATLWFMRGTSYAALAMYDNAIAAFDRSIQYDPSNLETYSNKSYVLNQQHKYRDAIKICDWVIKNNKNATNAYINKGFSLLGLKKYTHAIAEFDKAIAIDGNNINPYVGKAKAYSALKEHNKAIKIYDELIYAAKVQAVADNMQYLRDEELKKLKALSKAIFNKGAM